MADTLALDKIDWHSLDRIKFADEEALLEDLLKPVLETKLRQLETLKGPLFRCQNSHVRL